MLGANKFRDPFGQREGWGSSEPGEVWNRAKSPKAIILAMQWVRVSPCSRLALFTAGTHPAYFVIYLTALDTIGM